MKKVCILIFALTILIPCMATAEVDLSGMSYDELVTLKDQINLAMWNSQEWQEVEVPQGVWLVGEDIPAGHWSISPVTKFASVEIGTALDEEKKGISLRDSEFYHGQTIMHPSYKRYDKDVDLASIDYELKEGTYVVIRQANVCFTPYAGKPSLGFK